jgi:hypothetical protein
MGLVEVGFSTMLDLSRLNAYGAPDALVTTGAFPP